MLPRVGRPRLHDDVLRDRLRDRAAQIISADGQRALSLRGLAADVGTSTAAVYTLFGGKRGLLAAVYRDAFGRLAARLSDVAESDDPIDDLVRLGLAYRQAAVDDPAGYQVIFGGGLGPEDVTEADARAAGHTFDTLLDAVRRAVAADRLPTTPQPAAIATALWGNVHGLVSLELIGTLPPSAVDPGTVFEAAVRAFVAGWATPTAPEAASLR